MTSYPKLSKIKKSKFGGYLADLTISRGRVRSVRGETPVAVQAEADALIAQMIAPISAEEQRRRDDARAVEMLRVQDRAAFLATAAGREAVAQDIEAARHAGITADAERIDYVGGQW